VAGGKRWLECNGEQRAKMAFRTEVAGRQLWPKVNGGWKVNPRGGWKAMCTDGKSG
jgi:hypothetical protein